MTKSLGGFKDKIKICAIVGPTACGKSDLAIWLAREINAEIVSADSMQIYKGMDIGTAKPTLADRDLVTHHMIDFLDPKQSFSVAEYVREANFAIEGVVLRNKRPILVGGTGLYIDSLLDGIEFCEQKTDPEIRKKLFDDLEKFGAEHMFNRLKALDFEYAQNIHPNNTKRVIRGLEICLLTGLNVSENMRLSRKKATHFDSLRIGLTFSDRKKLYKKIDDRVDYMIERGLIQEARKFFDQRKLFSTSAQAIGYKEFWDFFLGKQNLDEAISKIKQNTRKYAKRQLTWFRKDRRINWIYCDDMCETERKNKVMEIVKRHFEIKL